MKRAAITLLESTRASGHPLPNLKTYFRNFAELLDKRSLPKAEVTQRLAEAVREAGYTQEEFINLLGDL